MRKLIYAAALVLMTVSCNSGKTAKQAQSAADSTVTATDSTAAGKETDQKTQVENRVKEIFDTVYAWYAKAEKDISLLDKEPDFESKYMSSDYLAVYHKVKEHDKALEENSEVGFFAYDHWVRAQDFQNIHMTVKSVTPESDRKYIAVITVHNMDQTYDVEVTMVWESGEWQIDDLYDLPEDGKNSPEVRKRIGTEKTQMKNYLKNAE